MSTRSWLRSQCRAPQSWSASEKLRAQLGSKADQIDPNQLEIPFEDLVDAVLADSEPEPTSDAKWEPDPADAASTHGRLATLAVRRTGRRSPVLEAMSSSTKPRTKFSLVGLLLALLGAWLYSGRDGEGTGVDASTPPVESAAPSSEASESRATRAQGSSAVGFTSQKSWQSHFEKHGHEFGDITAEEYLALAQTLRDAPLSKDVIEAVREQDDVRTRFDRRSGAFLAFHADKTIRTFFRPNDGEAYFERQLTRSPEGGR